MIVEYSSSGIPVSDNNALKYAKEKWDEGKNINVSTENVILAFRVLVKRQVISHKEITFLSHNQTIRVDSKGSLDHYPSEFCEIVTDLLSELC